MVPDYVIADIERFAGADYEYHFFGDKDAETYLASNYRPEVVQRFRDMSRGAHKSDLLRYALLFDTGGVYLDIDTVLVESLRTVFRSPLTTATTVLSTKKRTVFQAIVAAPARHPLLGRLLEHTVYTPLGLINCEDPGRRTEGGCRRGLCTACVSIFTRYFFDELTRHFGKEPTPGVFAATTRSPASSMAPLGSSLLHPQRKDSSAVWELFQEECDDTNATLCSGSFDRYGHCCVVRRNHDGSIVFLSRNPNFQELSFAEHEQALPV